MNNDNKIEKKDILDDSFKELEDSLKEINELVQNDACQNNERWFSTRNRKWRNELLNNFMSQQVHFNKSILKCINLCIKEIDSVGRELQENRIQTEEIRLISNQVAESLNEIYKALESRDDEIRGIYDAVEKNSKQVSESLNEIYKALESRDDEIRNIYESVAKRNKEISDYIGTIDEIHNKKEYDIVHELRENIKQNRLLITHLQTKLSGMDLIINNLFDENTSGSNESKAVSFTKKNNDIQERLLDASYEFFENIFRGTRDEIKKRQSVYLPYVKEAFLKTDHSPMIDLGSGRGEWLELLKENHIDGYGVDINKILVEKCNKNGLKVIENDIHFHIKNIKSNSIGGVTCFHLIEHIPFNKVVLLFKEVMRVLKPGGVFIIETPNPENVSVSTYSFYLDPTHRKPFPASLIQFEFKTEGFTDVEIQYLHPFEETYMINEKNSQIAERFNQYFYGAQDYSVIGFKQ